jgi:flagellar biosynthesis/type III secretory pathway protein FliH
VPLIKNVRARELVQGAVVMNLGDVREEAAQILSDAREEAARILAEARAEATRLTEGAADRGHAEGLARGEAEGREIGLEQGRIEGAAAAEAAMNDRLSAISEGWTTALEQILQSRELLRDEARRDLLRLALAIAERVLGRLPAHDPTIIVDQVEAAIAMLSGATRLRVRVNPDDLEMIERHFAGAVAGIRAASDLDVRMESDETIIRGGCVVSAGDGEIDSRLDQQISRIVHGVFPELLEVPVEPSPTDPTAPASSPMPAESVDVPPETDDLAKATEDIEGIEDIARDLAELGFDDLDDLEHPDLPDESEDPDHDPEDRT